MTFSDHLVLHQLLLSKRQLWIGIVQLLVCLVLWLFTVGITWLIYKRQDKSNKQQWIIGNIWNKLLWISLELSVAQRKLEHFTTLLRDAERRWKENLYNQNEVDTIISQIESLKITMDELKKWRDDVFDLYDEEIMKNL
jgi:hypothetical protein